MFLQSDCNIILPPDSQNNSLSPDTVTMSNRHPLHANTYEAAIQDTSWITRASEKPILLSLLDNNHFASHRLTGSFCVK